MLTKLEDQILMTVWKFQGDAYGVNVCRHLEKVLDRLTKRGFLHTYKGYPTAVRGGMRKKYYTITQKGIDELAKSKGMHDRIWDGYGDLATE